MRYEVVTIGGLTPGSPAPVMLETPASTVDGPVLALVAIGGVAVVCAGLWWCGRKGMRR